MCPRQGGNVEQSHFPFTYQRVCHNRVVSLSQVCRKPAQRSNPFPKAVQYSIQLAGQVFAQDHSYINPLFRTLISVNVRLNTIQFPKSGVGRETYKRPKESPAPISGP